MAFLQDFEFDIFISYARVDNEEAETKPGWVERFCQYLQVELDKLLGRKNAVRIWCDTEMDGNLVFDMALQTRLRQSALLLVLTSRGYLESEWCGKELKWFCESAKQQAWGLRIGNRLRISNVLLRNIPHDEWPEVYQGVGHHPFHSIKRQGEIGRPFPVGSEDFVQCLYNLCDTLNGTLSDFKKLIAAGAVGILPGDVLLHPPAPSGKWFQVVCVSPQENVEEWLPVEGLRAWAWQRSAGVRWAMVKWSKAEPELLSSWLKDAQLLVLNRSPKNTSDADVILRQVQQQRPEMPVLVINFEASQSLSLPALSHSGGVNLSSYRLASLSLRELNIPKHIEDAFGRLKLKLPVPEVGLCWPQADQHDAALFRESVTEWLDGEARLQLTIQKFFPQARQAQLFADRASWAGARLLQFSVDDGAIYLLKFFEQWGEYKREWACREEVERWLGEQVFALQPVEDLADPLEAFPIASPNLYPVCYRAPSTTGAAYATLSQCYRQQSFDFVRSALDRVLEILFPAAPPSAPELESPWGRDVNDDLCWTWEMGRRLRTALDDLELYIPALNSAQGGWDESYQRLRRFGRPALPTWLTRPCPVLRWHSHGNPEMRNCLVNTADPCQVRLIGCGGYQAKGRLVSDLALIEHDLKIRLLQTEAEAGGLFDLTHLQAWCEAERRAIGERLAFRFKEAAGASAPVQRAYAMIGQVRRRALEVCANDRHYFAALLYQTVGSITSPLLHPAKRLLALHSAAEILRAFEA